ncbi:MAG: amidophosphoribosyltransferase [Syntrophales bacterium]|jgi:amidophosphoribosyltransferase|nr:amidophosphoribosyltransferase [Syntrophales bacterium]MCK9527762.1 amidophosphoribosyltransferase [Syntrophales bacterium]MDX9921583.1 amidophosphoribosyltransferase [Syntrophales bacterium]
MHFIQENCGVFGICSQYDCSGEIFQAIDFLQHRGQQYCGISTYDGTIHHETHRGKVAYSFPEEELMRLRGRWGIGHVSLRDRQPLRWRTRLGEISVCFSGNVINAHELVREMMGRGKSFLEATDVEIISKIIIEGSSLTDGIADLAGKIRGAYSLVVLSKDGIYAARDTYGFRPLILGQDAMGTRYAVASESRALENLDMEVYRDVAPGEIVLINNDGIRTLARLPSPRIAHCAFEWAYTASMDSIIDGVYVQEARDNLGESLAQRDLEEGVISADIVAPVPMSGIGHALGYHKRSRINYQEVFLYNRYADRSYTQATQRDREKMAKRKLSILPYVKGKRIVLCDDSIIRGTQIRYKVMDLKEAGAREVHVRVACPPLMYPCDFGISTRSYGELLARSFLRVGDIISIEQQRALEAWVAAQVGADSVKFNTIDDFVASLLTERGNLCLACFDGIVPYSADI